MSDVTYYNDYGPCLSYGSSSPAEQPVLEPAQPEVARKDASEPAYPGFILANVADPRRMTPKKDDPLGNRSTGSSSVEEVLPATVVSNSARPREATSAQRSVSGFDGVGLNGRVPKHREIVSDTNTPWVVE